jgi:hypothetical protein
MHSNKLFKKIPQSTLQINKKEEVVEEFEISISPVTMGQYAEFLKQTSYAPIHARTYEDWEGPFHSESTLPVSLEDVINNKSISSFFLDKSTLPDAQRYCSWKSGVRLPSFSEMIAANLYLNTEECILLPLSSAEIITTNIIEGEYGVMANFPWNYISRIDKDRWIEMTFQTLVKIDLWNIMCDAGGFRVCLDK